MFQCHILLIVPLELGIQVDFSSVKIADYDYDPGLQIGDEVQATFEQDGQKFDLVTLVTKRHKRVISNKSSKSIFRLYIYLEAQDREKVVKWAETLKISDSIKEHLRDHSAEQN
ncbi:hypothetical protein [Allocoleopsis franciscana]|uniref:Uncharacterized protein n=1 Tax=Allocoleopsis franciscana PCC 7113 TaxID=1173027 RepID=K9WCA3_9CYAN|nr:hypothetical protein [Allocoleopsis franciscana]AFZ17441.1 hypothetical protein Mic7113_1565 [Allocoleopsis franciscana PCC 7113]